MHREGPEKSSSDPLVGDVHGYSLDVQQLGLSPKALQTGCHALLDLLLVKSQDVLHDLAGAVHLDALDEPLQEELLVLCTRP